MHDFPRLLLNASMAMGTLLAVAKLGASRARLERALNDAQRPAVPHPRRRAMDARLQLVRR